MAAQTNLLSVLERFMTPGTSPIGLVFPPRSDAPNLPDKGARYCALDRFCDFLSYLPFMRTMAGPPQPFLVPRDQIHVYRPKSPQSAPDGIRLPAIAFNTSEADETTTGWLGPDILIDGSEDVYGPNTALFYLGDHVEELQLEVIASEDAQRRAIVEGIKQAIRSSDDSGAFRLSVPAYFDQDAEFLLLRSKYVEDEHAVRNRRVAQLTIQLYIPEVMLANAITLQPIIQVGVQTAVEAIAEAALENG